MKTILTPLVVLWICTLDLCIANTQDPTVQWVKTYNGPAETFDEANSVVYDSSEGTIIVAGRGWDTEGMVNVFVVKYNSDGDVVWDYVWDGPASFEDTPWDIEVSSTGNIYVCGQSKTADGYWDSDMFLLALDSDGNYLWEDVYGLIGAYFDIAYEIRLDYYEFIYIVGNDNQGETNNLYGGGIVNRYTPEGALDWTIHHNASTVYEFNDGLAAMDIDINQNVVMGGATTLLNTWYDMACMSYSQTGDQNWINTVAGSDNNTSESFVDVETDIYGNTFALGHTSSAEWKVVKYDEEGLFQWDYLMEDLSFNQAWGVDYMHSDGQGNLYYAVTAAGDIYLTKLSPDGDVLWQSIWASALGYSDDVYQMTSDLAGNIYIAGRAGIGNSYYDMLMLKYDTNGNLVWDVNFDGPAINNDEAHGLVVSPDGSVIYLVGYTRGYTPNADLTVVKYAQKSNDVNEATLPSFSIYPNPAEDVIGIQSSVLKANAAYTITNSIGEVAMSGTLAAGQQVDTSTLSAGLYMVSVEGQVRRFVKR